MFLQLDIPPLKQPITYNDGVLLIGSCFTEHISGKLAQYKFRTLANPHGILFNPLSVAYSLDSYLDNKQYNKEELFYLNELWNSWDHHTRFSHIDNTLAIEAINQSQQQAAAFIKEADFVIITLGSAFQYYLTEGNRPVANNHRAPAQWFQKRLLPVAEITAALGTTLQRLFDVNPSVQVLFTISPVRHIRDGLVDNNRSKARLIEAVHALCTEYEAAYYFPAYELVIDVLRDYRFYDIDYVHPNYQATSYVWERFTDACIAPAARPLMQQVHEIVTARSHRARFPETEAHRKFMTAYAAKTEALMAQHPKIDLREELEYFRKQYD